MVDRIQRRGYTYISRIFVYTVYACVCVCIHIVEGSLYARENVIWQVNVADNAFRINSFLILYALNELQLDYQSSLSLPPPHPAWTFEENLKNTIFREERIRS